MINKDGERVLAYIVTVDAIDPIPNADKIERATIGGWHVVISKADNFHVNQEVVYIEVDSRVPSNRECFAFLEPRNYKVKTAKFRGQISQGLILPLTVLPPGEYHVGDDVTETLGITKIQDRSSDGGMTDEQKNMARLSHYRKRLMKKKWFKKLMRHAWFRAFVFRFLIPKKKPSEFPTKFPGVTKTDEERVENMTWVLNEIDSELQTKPPYIVTTKIDGTSSTYILDRTGKKEEQWVLSRNVRQFRGMPNYHDSVGDDNVYWEVADKYRIFEFLDYVIKTLNLKWACVQGETAGVSLGGKKIQGDPHRFGTLRFFIFNLIIDGKGRLPATDGVALVAEFNRVYNGNLSWVPIVSTQYTLPDTIDEFKLEADGECEAVGAHGLREGYVYRKVYDPNFSFKNVSNKYLLKYQDVTQEE